VLIFGVPTKATKDNHGSCADAPGSVVIEAIKIFRTAFPKLLVAWYAQLTQRCLPLCIHVTRPLRDNGTLTLLRVPTD
jgi:hypothetical protein